MSKKRLPALMLSLVLLLAVLTGCGAPAPAPVPTPAPVPEATPEQPAALYKAGTYTAEAQGNNGPVNVSVTLSDDAIVSVTVGEHAETAGICETPISRIPEAIVAGQTLAVDTVTGATNTSKAILQAVEDCIAQGGGDIAALKAAQAGQAGPSDVQQLSADIVVVGGGGAGMVAAVQAHQLGASVIIIEKTAAVGGNTNVAGGNYAAVDPERQSKQGIEDSVEKHIEQVFEGGDKAAKRELVEVMCSNALDGLHWLEDLGVQWNDEVFQVIGSLWPRTHSNVANSGSLTVQVLRKHVEEDGTQVLLDTKATELIMENNAVTGAKATGADGTQYEVRGTKGVILTTGGFGANIEMCMQYSPKITTNTQTLSVQSAQGEGLAMAEAVGANLIGMKNVQMLPTSLDLLPANNNNVLYLNQAGVRFVQEDGRRDKMSNTVLEQEGGYCFVMFDQQVVDKQDAQDKADKQIADGKLFKADTIADLAKQMGMPADALQATVNAYNASVSGKTADAFGRTLFELPIGDGPYYCSVKQYPMVLYTAGGVDIDTQAHVLDANGQPIPGLYAAGEVTGGVHGTNRLGSHAFADLTVFGRIAAKTALGK